MCTGWQKQMRLQRSLEQAKLTTMQEVLILIVNILVCPAQARRPCGCPLPASHRQKPVSHDTYGNWKLTRWSAMTASFSAAVAWQASPADDGPAVCSAARTFISSAIRSITRFISAIISELWFTCLTIVSRSRCWSGTRLVGRVRHAEAAGTRRPMIQHVGTRYPPDPGAAAFAAFSRDDQQT